MTQTSHPLSHTWSRAVALHLRPQAPVEGAHGPQRQPDLPPSGMLLAVDRDHRRHRPQDRRPAVLRMDHRRPGRRWAHRRRRRDAGRDDRACPRWSPSSTASAASPRRWWRSRVFLRDGHGGHDRRPGTTTVAHVLGGTDTAVTIVLVHPDRCASPSPVAWSPSPSSQGKHDGQRRSCFPGRHVDQRRVCWSSRWPWSACWSSVPSTACIDHLPAGLGVSPSGPGAGRHAGHPHRRRRHAGGHLAAQLLLGPRRRDDRLRAAATTCSSSAGSLVGRVGPHPHQDHVQGHEPLAGQRALRRLRRADGERRRRQARVHQRHVAAAPRRRP